MPVIFETKLDGSSGTRYFHISLVRFYLDQAYKNAEGAKTEGDENNYLAFCISGIMFSAMSLEAFANEVSEDIVPKEEINDFIHLRKRYRKNKGESSVSAKYRILFKMKHDHDLESDIEDKIGELISLRNNLVHYKITELSGKYIMPSVTNIQCSDGMIVSSIDFMVQPERVEPPFIQKINSESVVTSFNTALSVIKKWGALLGEPDSVPGLEEIA
ncbi:MAG: hypothetical protein GXP60_05685 [Epsilonproteobacteria bacterium]|nr:hypothetical protein [Campylobacterota bacterium]